MVTKAIAYPRAALAGNPSDAFYGKTLAFTFRDFSAEAVVEKSPELHLCMPNLFSATYENVGSFLASIEQEGYDESGRLVQATLKTFVAKVRKEGGDIGEQSFRLECESMIPREVGLAGSSAVVTACMRALAAYHGIQLKEMELASLVWQVEYTELQTPSGPQDRVVQACEGLVYMDFSRGTDTSRSALGDHVRMDAALLPPLYIAYLEKQGEQSDRVHRSLHDRFRKRDPKLDRAVAFWADLTDQARRCLLQGDCEQLASIVDANYDMREQICNLKCEHRWFVQTARSAGACAKFTGSGGAIVGVLRDDEMYGKLQQKLEPLGAKVIRPTI